MQLITRTLFLAVPLLGSAPALAADVLILGGTVTGGSASQEAARCIATGFTIEVVSDAAWSAKTAAEFGALRAIILGDPTCIGPGVTASITAATANNAVWGPQIDGNTIVIGTDPVYHSTQGGLTLTNAAVDFVLADATKTGALLGLSCYYDGAAPLTPIPLLGGLPGVSAGSFTAIGVSCANDAHVTAVVPALATVNDTNLSNWSCSVHNGFNTWPDTGPAAFTVFAIARNVGTIYTAPDGSVGTPFILTRGTGVVSPFTGYCFGDGTATACPCGNAGATGNGCASSVNAAGANLNASGAARVAFDSLILSGTGMPNGTALYFQGTSRLNAGLGLAFGDGLRCAGGTVIRLGTKQNAGGASQYPGAGDPLVSIRGLIPAAGGTRTYQAWYRNAAAFCTTSTFNLSNGLEVVWTP